MMNLIKWLVGLRQLPQSAAEGYWRIELESLPEGLWAIGGVALLLLAIVGIWFLYRLEGRNLSLKTRVALAITRSLVVLCVVGMLLDAVLVITRHDQVPSHLLVLVDNSQSMALKDPYPNDATSQAIAERLNLPKTDSEANLRALREINRLQLASKSLAPLMKELSQGRLLSVYQFSSKAEPLTGENPLDAIRPEGVQTSVGDAIKQALASHRGQPMSGVLLVTDGQSNGGEDPRKIAEQAGKDGVVIHSLAVGTEQGPTNVRLADLELNPVVFVRDPTQLAVLVESRGMVGKSATITLEKRQDAGEWSEFGRSDVILGEDGAVQRVAFDMVPDTIGQFDYRATVSDAGVELTETDNAAVKSMRVIRQRIRVLLIAGYPSPEVQFLRNALLRDNALEFASWLQSARENYEHVGHKPIRRLPSTQKEFDFYDVIVVFDPDTRALGVDWPERITKFVGDAGGGLIYVAGELNSQKLFGGGLSDGGATDGGSWVRMLPVVSDPGLYQSAADIRLSAREAWNFELTADGNDDPIFRFAANPSRNREILASLPGMYWHFPVTRAKPGATILAQHGDQRMQNQFGRHVLMAMQRYGPGRAVFIGFDSTFRWRYLHEEYFDGFWARLIDRVGRSKVLGGRYPFTLSTDKSVYRTGDQVTIRAQLAGSQDDASILSQLRGEVELAGQEPITLDLQPQIDRADVVQSTFNADKGGTYLLRVVPGAATDEESAPRPATLTFKVEPPQQEVDKPGLNRPLLDEIARASGGRVFSLADALELPKAFKIREVERVLEYREELWDAPLWSLLIVLLLTVEWVLRKHFRMA